MKLEFSRHVFEKYSNISFNENPSGRNRVVPSELAESPTDLKSVMKKLIVTFPKVAYAPNQIDDWLTVHRSITLVDLQLDAQNSYLFAYNIFIKILYMSRALPYSSSGGLRSNFIYAASGIVTLCRGLSFAQVKKELSFLTSAQDSHLQRVTIPEAAYIQLRRRPPEDEQGNARNM